MAKKTTKTLEEITAEIEAQAEANKNERAIKALGTDNGRARYLNKKDAVTLSTITKGIEDITGKPMFTGFTFSSNVETIIAIASALQFMKKDQREQVPSALYTVFSSDIRDEILDSAGRLPYLAEDATIEIHGELIPIDPEAKERASQGIKCDVEALESVVNEVALSLGLLAEYSLTQKQADDAWNQAVARLSKNQLLESYKESLED